MSRPATRPLAALEARIQVLETRVRALERGKGPRDSQDEALIMALATATRGLSFSARALWRHSAVDGTLAAALEDACVDSPRQLGKLLRRFTGHDMSGWHVDRVGADRDGIRWRLRECKSETCDA